jgi:hypothetical protein
MALLDNIRLGWKGLAGTNAPTYYEHSSIMSVIFFIKIDDRPRPPPSQPIKVQQRPVRAQTESPKSAGKSLIMTPPDPKCLPKPTGFFGSPNGKIGLSGSGQQKPVLVPVKHFPVAMKNESQVCSYLFAKLVRSSVKAK